MKKELLMNYKFDKPFVYSGDENETEEILSLKIQPESKLRNDSSYTIKGTDFCIVLDTSGSMRSSIDSTTDKLDAAVNSVKALYDYLSDEDTISLVLYNDVVYTELDHAKNLSKQEFENHVEKAYTYNGATNITNALRTARKLLEKNTGNQKKIIFLTDGLPTNDTKEEGYQEGINIAEDRIPITALGIGYDFDYQYIEKLVKPSKGTTNHIDSSKDSIRIFEETLNRAKSIVINNINLELQVSNKVIMTDYYRAVPETTYYGKMPLKKERIYNINLDDLEKGRYAEYIFNIKIPASSRAYKGKFRVMQATLTYDIPATGEKKEIKENIVLEITDDFEMARQEYGEVAETATKCTVKKLEDKMEIAEQNGEHRNVIKIIDEIIDLVKDFGDTEITEHYKDLREKYINTNQLPKDALIKAVSSTTKINSDGIIEDEEIDFEELENKIF